MIYSTTSSREVIARVVRNTRLQDSSFLSDMNEWLPEAMGYMKTKVALQPFYQDVKISFHRGRLPCGLQAMSAVQHKGYRLRYYDPGVAAGGLQSTIDNAASVYPGIPLRGTTVFGTHLVRREAEDEGIPVEFLETDLCKVMDMDFLPGHWYYTELDHITTSFEKGIIRIHGRRIPVDAKGFPLIPDDELYKEALYYYARAKMIGAGYTDKVFSEAVCMQRFEDYAQRAISRITYPSVDQVEGQVGRLSRLIMADDYWDSFGNPGPERQYGMENTDTLYF
jgi:hypothetical protein